MFNTLLPPIYKWLRRCTGLSQGKLADELGAGRTSIYNFEHGKARPSPEQEAKLVELADCCDEEFAQRLFDGLAEALDRPVGLVHEVRALARQARGRSSAGLLRALNNQMEAVEHAALRLKRSKRDLEDLAAVVAEDLATEKSHMGATGREARPVLHTSGRDAGRDRETQTD